MIVSYDQKISSDSFDIVWLRRNLRLEKNRTIQAASTSGRPLLLLFIFDPEILDCLPKDDARVSFIYSTLVAIDKKLKNKSSSLLVCYGKPKQVIQRLIDDHNIGHLHHGRDYEPYARSRDNEVKEMCEVNGVNYHSHNEHVIFEPQEILKKDGTPYMVYTPYKNAWREKWIKDKPPSTEAVPVKFLSFSCGMPSLKDIGFVSSSVIVQPFSFELIDEYDKTRDFPAKDTTSHLGPYLRFGIVSTEEICNLAEQKNPTFFDQLIWREFYIQILYHYPHVEKTAFRKKYENIPWDNITEHFEKWKSGQTGYSIVDAGMNQLAQTGTMHNRVRMICASFLVKNLLIDWRWGEAYFAQKLLDFDLAANNGNWQWVAGTGCDAAPYFRVFNPETQAKKFDPKGEYRRQWLSDDYLLQPPPPLVDLKESRSRAIERYKKSI